MRRRVFVVGAIVAAGMIVGSGAYTSVSADRGVNVEVADDSNAYMALDTLDENKEANSGSSITLVEIRNQFSEQVTFTVTNITTDLGVSPDEPSVTVGGGNEKPVKVQLECDSTVDTSISFDIEAHGVSVAVNTTAKRTAEHVTCNA